MKQIFTLWTADRWLMTNSFVLHGIFSSLENAIAYAKKKDLLGSFDAVVINCGEVDNYELSCQRVLCSTFEKDRQKMG